MAPKKKVEENPLDKPPEGDDERLLTVKVTGTVPLDFLTSLKFPTLICSLSAEESTRTEIPPEQASGCDVSVVVYNKKINITPQFVESVLSGNAVLSFVSLPEVKEAPSPVAAAKGKAPPGKAAAKGKETIGVGIGDAPLEELNVLFSFPFDLCDCYSSKECTRSFTTDCGKWSLTITVSDLLLAPMNLMKYIPLIVEVQEVDSLPSSEPISLRTNGFQSSSTQRTMPSTDSDKVTVEYRIFGETIGVPSVARKGSKAIFGHRRTFFLYKQNRLELLQSLFFNPVQFVLRDGPKSSGVASLNLRQAVTHNVKRFTAASQVMTVPREGVVDSASYAPHDYLSYGTTLKLKASLLADLPTPHYIGGEGSPSGTEDASFLARGLIFMPYTSPVIPAALQAIMGTLVNIRRGGVDSILKEAEPAPPTEGKKSLSSPTPDAGKLRVVVPTGVSGFEIMDSTQRILCFEGPLHVVHRLVEVATAVIGDDPSSKVLLNTELQFPQRWYHSWPSLVVPLINEKPVQRVTTPVLETKGKGKAAAAPPPKKGKPTASPESSEQPVARVAEADEAPEIDAGGVGGRIRRIRLAKNLADLAAEQKNFVRRTLPIDAVHCVNKLTLLREASSVLFALDQNLFPTTTEIIALERVHGSTLELLDVCGTDEFVSFVDADVQGIMRQYQSGGVQKKKSLRDVDVIQVTAQDVGMVVSFEAMPALAHQCPQDSRRMLKNAFPALEHKAFLFSTERNQSFLCAFSKDPPTQVLRYLFTAQVILSGGAPILFVIDSSSLAKNASDHRNKEFEAKLRRDRKRAKASEYFTMMASRKEHYAATHTLSTKEYRDVSSDDEEGFQDGPPSVDKGLNEQDLEPNYVVLNRRENVKKNALRSASEQPRPDYELAQLLYDAEVAKTLPKASPTNKSGEAFRVVHPRTSAETRHHPQSLSSQRVEDLKEPWVPAAAYKGLKAGALGIRFNGAKEVLMDPNREKSVFGGLSAEEKKAQELQDRQQHDVAWRKGVVVDDPHFKVSCRLPSDKPVSQLDALNSMLDSAPQKLSLKKTFVPPAPASIFPHEMKPKVTRKDANAVGNHSSRQFYYPPGTETKVPVPPLTESEKLAPIWGSKKEM